MLTSLGTPVPFDRTQHTGDEYVVDDTDDVVSVPSENDSLCSETSGSDFGDQAVANRSDGELVKLSKRRI